MTSGALATSGNYEIYFDREKLFHHIVNPSTGRSPRTDTSASVRAPRAAMADAMSTACFVLPPHQAMRLLKAQNLEGLIYTRNRQRYATESFWG
jgi:thiamine biosynthesis lipoprotein